MLSEKFKSPHPISLKEIANELQISESTLRRKRRDAGLHIPRGLVNQQNLYSILKLFYCEEIINNLLND